MIDVVIPARNEADTIGPVIRAFREVKYIGSIIVVDDCSSDTTNKIAAEHGAYVLLAAGEGKGQAVRAGLDWAETEYVCLCDGDLTGLTPDHVWQLIADHVQSYDSMVIGVPDFPERSPVPWPVRMDAFAQMSGERCLPVSLVRGLDLHGYAMEEQVNRAAARAGLPVRYVRLEGVTGKVRENSRRMAELRRDRAWLAGHDKGITA